MKVAIKNIGLWIALGFNLFLLTQYWMDPGQSRSVVFLFWIQGIIAGAECLIKMVFAKPSEVMNTTSEESPVGWFQKVFLSIFFIIHFGVFILFTGALAVFNKDVSGGLAFASWVWPAMLLLGIAAVIELPSKVARSRSRGTSAFILMFQPYVKLIPLAAIIFGAEFLQVQWVFPIFLLLKTGADLFYAAVVDGSWGKGVSPSASV